MVRKTIKIIAIILVVVLLGFMIPADKAKALSFGLPFGGKITSVIPCTCPASLGSQITVGAPRPGVYMYKPGVSRLFRNYMILRPGAWVVGIATAYMPCMQVNLEGTPPCIPLSTGGPLINLVGTSF